MHEWLPRQAVRAVEDLDLTLSVRSVPEIDFLLSRTVLFRGKRLRPTLCFLMGQLFGVPVSVTAPYARASEFVHAATLAHDDVIDESPMRRNRPTLNARSSNARAVLAGDLLLARVMTELSALGEILIISDLSQTIEDLVHGEWLQLEARRVPTVTRQHLETVAKKKTASLMIWCCGTASRLAKRNDETLRSCQLFGEALGVAFQMIDDIIDYNPGGEKPFAHDLREGLVNFVTLEMLENNPDLFSPVRRLLGEAPPSDWPWRPDELSAACNRVRARAQAKLEVADTLLTQISRSLDAPDFEALQAFRSLLVYLKERMK